MVQNIKSALLHTSTFVDLANIVNNVKEDISFLGQRYVYLDDFEGRLHIDSLAMRVMILIRSDDINFLDDQEKEAFFDIIPKINEIYARNDARMTSVFCALRDRWSFYVATSFTGYDVRFDWQYVGLPDLMRAKDRPHIGYDAVRGLKFSKEKSPLSNWLGPWLIKEDVESVLNDCTSCTDLLPVLEAMQGDVSFFGSRYVYFVDFDGTLPIHELVSRVMEVAMSSLDYAQDVDYQNSVPLIDALYVQTDEKKLEKNSFTRVLCAIRDLWNHYFGESFQQSLTKWEQFKDDSAQKSG